jgi:hypothetical protein
MGYLPILIVAIVDPFVSHILPSAPHYDAIGKR